MQNHKHTFHFEHWHFIALCLMVYDALAVNVSYFLALLLRFDFRYSIIPQIYLRTFFKFASVYTIFCLILFWLLNLYKSIWRFASYHELVKVVESSVISAIFHTIGITLLFRRLFPDLMNRRMPLSYYVIGAGIQFALILGVRFSYRFVLLLSGRPNKNESGRRVPRIMIVGAGQAGQMILRDIKQA